MYHVYLLYTGIVNSVPSLVVHVTDNEVVEAIYMKADRTEDIFLIVTNNRLRQNTNSIIIYTIKLHIIIQS